MKFRTFSGSTYEIDLVNDRIRQLSGANPVPERRVNWRHYINNPAIEVGYSAFIIWDEASVPMINGRLACTTTSKVVEIFDDSIQN